METFQMAHFPFLCDVNGILNTIAIHSAFSICFFSFFKTPAAIFLFTDLAFAQHILRDLPSTKLVHTKKQLNYLVCTSLFDIDNSTALSQFGCNGFSVHDMLQFEKRKS